MFKFFGKKKAEVPATITLADHEAALALMAKANVDLEQERDQHRRRGDNWMQSAFEAARKVEELNVELAALRPDAEKYRRSRANLKQFRDKGVA